MHYTTAGESIAAAIRNVAESWPDLRDALVSTDAPSEADRTDVHRAALARLDAIARVEPRNAVGEAELIDALAPSFSALHPSEQPVWKPTRLLAEEPTDV